MEFLAPMTAVIAALATVPLLVLLYFLKLKRQETVVSSTLLWKRAVRDLQVNAPFQKLRRNLLLLLQLLALGVILLALARPVLSMLAGPAKRYVLLIDCSGSMNATDVKPSRLEVAKDQARTLIESLRESTPFSLSGETDQAMIIAFDDHAKVMCNFTSDKRQLLMALESIEASDGGSSLAEAVAVARAFAQPIGQEDNNRSAQNSAQLELFSDGGIADAEQVAVTVEELNYHCVGEQSANVAVVAMQARRSYEKAQQVNVFATLANYGSRAVSCDVQLSIDGNIRAVRSVDIPGRQQAEVGKDALPGKVSLSFVLSYAGSGVLEVRQLRADPVSCDDAAWAVLRSPKRLAVLLVTRGNMALSSALAACPLAKLDQRSPEEFEQMDISALAAGEAYDVIVLDGYAPDRLPRGRYLVFGNPPNGLDVTAGEELKNQVVVDWRSQHPVLQFVNLTNLFVGRCQALLLPREATVLSEFGSGPAMAIVSKHGSTFLLVGFEVMESNWPFEPGFVMFCYNATAFLGMELDDAEERSLKVGQAIRMEGLRPELVTEVDGPELIEQELKCDASGVLRFPRTRRAGMYSVRLDEERLERFAVNFLNEMESNIEPSREIVLSGVPVQAQSDEVNRTNVQLWPILVVLALVLVCLEWFVYNSRARL